MKTEVWILMSILLLIILFVSGCSSQPSVDQNQISAERIQAQKSPQELAVENCKSKIGAEREDCFVDLAKTESDKKICSNVEDPLKSRRCISLADFSAHKKEMAAIVEAGDVSACKGDIICINRIAVAKEDISVCTGNDEEKNICEILIVEKTGDEKICESKKDIFRDFCYSAAAYSKQSSSHCEKISEEYDKEICKMDVAIKKNDASLCSDSEFNSDLCIATVSNDASKCENVDAYYECLNKIAVETNDPSVCSKIKGELSGECIMRVAEANKESSYCEFFEGDRLDICLNRLAMSLTGLV